MSDAALPALGSTAIASAQPVAARRKRRPPGTSLTRTALIWAVAIVWLLPVVWIFATAFKAPRDVLSLRILFAPTLHNFVVAFGDPFFLGERLMNSAIVTVATLVIALPISTAAAYAFSRFRFPGGSIWPLGVLATQFLPPVIIIIPLFIAFRGMGLLDTRTALVIANMSFVLPYAIWMIKGFIDALPIDMEEAAQMDGASRVRAIWDVVVPLILPGIATAAVFCFVVSWNEFFYALVLTRQDATTLPVALMGTRTDQGDAWEVMATMGLVIMLPMLVIARLMQRFFTKGITTGGVR